MKLSRAIFTIIAGALIAWILTGCSAMTFRGSVTYSGQYGDYSVTSDGKTITGDIRFAK